MNSPFNLISVSNQLCRADPDSEARCPAGSRINASLTTNWVNPKMKNKTERGISMNLFVIHSLAVKTLFPLC